MSLYLVGLTGSSGSGKTTVCEYLKQKELPIIDADQVARLVTEPNTQGLQELCQAFGADILNHDGSLNRRELSNRTFGKPKQQQLLNAVILPIILTKIEEMVEGYRQQQEPIVILDAPTLIESGAHNQCDFVVSVLSDIELRKQRIHKREPDLSAQQLQQRLDAQPENSFYELHSDFVIYNMDSLEKLQQKTEELWIVLQQKAYEND